MTPYQQLPLGLPPPPATGDTPLIPVRMINEWVYCPRLAYLEWVEGEWADSGDTAEGRRSHARVDEGGGHLPAPDDLNEDMARAKSVTMSSERLGIIAKMDVVEADGESATPIDFKKGKRPHVPAGAYEPERVQVCAQAMILEDNGYQVEQGALWYAGSRERVPVVLDNELRARTLEAISGLRSASTSAHRPPPLENSPKCPRCSPFAGICLPDETNLFRKGYPPRQLNPSDNPALPLYVQTPGRAAAQERGTVDRRGGRREGCSAYDRRVPGGAVRSGLRDDSGVARPDASGGSGVMVLHRWMVPRPHGRDRKRQRGRARGPVPVCL